MKNSNRFSFIGLLIFTTIVFVSGCKKDSDDPVTPAFTVTASTVNLQGGGEGLQFFVKCTNNDVVMESVTITDPELSIAAYDFKGSSFTKNELFGMQNTNEAYVKQTGNWKFNLVGNANGTAFAVDATFVVSK